MVQPYDRTTPVAVYNQAISVQRSLKKTPIQFTTLHFHFAKMGYYMSVTDFLQMLRDTGGQIVLTYDTAAVQAAFRYATDGRTPPCAMIDAIYITDQKSNLLEIFDMNLYSTSYHTRGREEKKEDDGLTDASTGRVRTMKLDESKLIPWFQPTGSNMTASSVMNSDPLSYHAVLPNTDNSNVRCVFMTDLSITGTPLFNR